MTPTEFTYWLQGFFELTKSKQLTTAQTATVKKHLALVLTNVTEPDKLPKSLSKRIDDLRFDLDPNKKYC